jgi:hypothetical protein
MFSLITRSMRIRMGWLVAAAYLFCVLAPAAALATGNAAPCLTDDVQVTVAHMPDHHADGAHVHGDTAHDHAGAHAHHHAAVPDTPVPHQHDGNNAPGPCCAMMCATALPADLPSIAKPVQPVSVCAPEVASLVHDTTPPLLYRPPIA